MTKSNRWSVFRGGIALKTLISTIMIVCMVCSVQAAVEADFEATPTSGTVPLIVAFTDNSTGKISNWLWDFGDGFASLLKNPLHMYLFAGEFDVDLTIFNATDEKDNITKESYINVTYPELPLFGDTDPSQIPGSLVVNKFFAETDPGTGEFLAEFTAFPTMIGDNPEFTWDFDDGSPDEVTDVPETTHSYGPGIYEPKVSVHSDGMTGYELDLPTYLIVISRGMNIDDLIEEEVEV